MVPSLSLSKHLWPCSHFVRWCEMTQCLHEEMKGGEWWRHCDVALGYYWPSDILSDLTYYSDILSDILTTICFLTEVDHLKWRESKMVNAGEGGLLCLERNYSCENVAMTVASSQNLRNQRVSSFLIWAALDFQVPYFSRRGLRVPWR